MTQNEAITLLSEACDEQSRELADGMIDNLIPYWIVVEKAIRNIVGRDDCKEALNLLMTDGPDDWDEGDVPALMPVLAHRFKSA